MFNQDATQFLDQVSEMEPPNYKAKMLNIWLQWSAKKKFFSKWFTQNAHEHTELYKLIQSLLPMQSDFYSNNTIKIVASYFNRL